MTSSMTHLNFKNQAGKEVHVGIFARSEGSPDPHARRLLYVLNKMIDEGKTQHREIATAIVEYLNSAGVETESHPQQVDFKYFVTFDFSDNVNSVRVKIVETEDDETLFDDSLGKLEAWIVDEEQGAND